MTEVEATAVATTPNPIPEDERKLFVGGLPQEAQGDDIKEYFGTYGEIENVNLKTDSMTGRSRGFAFVVFKDSTSLDSACAVEAHVIKVGTFTENQCFGSVSF